MNQYARTQRLIGKEAMEKLWDARLAVFGLGGVGGNAVEALARAGIGNLDLIDSDVVCLSNLNRQIISTMMTVGQPKTDVAEERIHAINPRIRVRKYRTFYLPEKRESFDFSQWDYIIDAIDTITAKIDIIVEANRLQIPIISAMGCGNRIDPTKLTITDIYKTIGDPLSKIMRHELKKRNIPSLKVVYSTEAAMTLGTQILNEFGKAAPGSTPFVPSVAGTMLAYQVVKDLIGFDIVQRKRSSAERTEL